jgi:hypothetical protein
VAEISKWMFGACPSGDDSSTCEAQEECRFLTDERNCAIPLFIKIGVFAELRIAASLFVTCNALDGADSVFVE